MLKCRCVLWVLVLSGVMAVSAVASPPAGFPSSLASSSVTLPGVTWETGVLNWDDSTSGYVSADGFAGIAQSGGSWVWEFLDPALGPGDVAGAGSWNSGAGAFVLTPTSAVDGGGNVMSDYSGVGVSGPNFLQGGAAPEPGSAMLMLPLLGLMGNRFLGRSSRRWGRSLSRSSASACA